MTRWLVTGAGGMLGRDLCAVLAPVVTLTALDRAALDITDPAQVTKAVNGFEVVINTAAWTDVDGAETREDAATTVNGHAVANLAGACAASGARLIHLSTDYVLPGTGTTAYPEDAATGPVNAYGRGKLVGEQAVLGTPLGYVVRTAWLYGAHGRNFVTTMLRLAQTRETLDVVDDQWGQPTWTVCLARQLAGLGHAALAGSAAPGVYHGTAAGSATWAQLAAAAFELAGLDPARIRPVTSAAFPRPAPRPSYGVLSHARWARTGVPVQPHWRDQLTEAFGSGIAL